MSRVPSAVLLALWSLLALCAPSVFAAPPRCTLEQIDLSALGSSGQVKVIGGSVMLEGTLNSELPTAAYRLQLNGKTVAKAEKSEPFQRTGREVYIALLFENSALYAPSIEVIKEATKEFVESLSPKMRVQFILFGYEIESQPVFMPAPAIAPMIDDVNPDDQGDVLLLKAITAAMTSLNKVQSLPQKDGKPTLPPRKMIVLLSDGLNELMDRKSFQRAGDLLRQNHVALFPIAFSPRDDRGPLRNLGELAKRSSGTFRWAQAEGKLKEQFQSLAEQLLSSATLTFSLKGTDAEDLAGASFTLVCGDQKSVPYVVSGTPPVKSGRWWKWLLGILLGLVLLWGAAQLAVVLLKKRARKLGVALPGGSAPAAAATGQAHPPSAPPVLAQAGYVPVPIVPGARLRRGLLIGIGAGPLGGQRFPVEASIYIGKAIPPGGHIQVPDNPNLGPTHCELRRDGAGYALYPYGPKDSSAINGSTCNTPTRINDGDILTLAQATQFRFRLED